MSQHHTQKSAPSQSPKGVWTIYKKAGETLAVLVERFRLEELIDSSVPVTYAGRLDPMAEGLMILLTGEECKKKDEYLRLPKLYEFEVLFGYATDTFDMLGLVTDRNVRIVKHTEIVDAIGSVQSQTHFSYPPYSSKTVDGIPLFAHARAGTLPDELPTKEGQIYQLELVGYENKKFVDVVESAIETINLVEGDFRQEEIVRGWQGEVEHAGNKEITIARFRAHVSSGVYIRSIAVEIGGILGVPVLAYSIKRVLVGEFEVKK